LVKAFAGDNICAVGDDDQSIYSWRGANFGNIERFEEDHPGVLEIKLERNYRSTSLILDAANTLIAHNQKRKLKNLWSPLGKKGVPIVLESAQDDLEEAEGIVARLRRLRISDSLAWDGFGILVRTNSQARVVEETLMEAGVPYRTAGGPSFYQRKEVRDMLAYLRLIANPDDDMSLLRIINVPRRGVGKTGLERITSFSRSANLSIRTALELARRNGDVLSQHRTVRDAMDFLDFIASQREMILARKKPLSAFLKDLVAHIGYWHYLVEEFRNEEKKAGWKYRNIELLAASIERWEKDPDTLDAGLFAYLARVALVTRDDPEDEEGKVSLLTIHAAKGLEFDVVFIPGCEEGIIPHARSIEDGGGDVEEERRLFYVALTRAKKKLFLSHCLNRRQRMQATETRLSSFIAELPEHLVQAEETPEPGKTEAELKLEMLARMKARFQS
jgi:DNA helicase-2/ATP-dependent DNA helicase PcrA